MATALIDGRERGRSAAHERPAIGAAPDRVPAVPSAAAGRQETHRRIRFSQGYPPQDPAGIARYTHALAEGLASRGHEVHVFTRQPQHPETSFEGNVWVHRSPDADEPWLQAIEEPPVRGPARRMEAVHQDLLRVGSRRPFDLIQTPNWDSEGLLVACDDAFRTVVSLQTTTRIMQKLNPNWNSKAVDLMAALEKTHLRQARDIHALSHSVRQHAVADYGVDPETGAHPRDPARAPRPQTRTPSQAVRRPRPAPLRRSAGAPQGDRPAAGRRARPARQLSRSGAPDRGRGPGQSFAGQVVCRSVPGGCPHEHLDRCRFLGKISDPDLYQEYANADIFCAPSRYESFGLILVEAMMFSLPCIGGRVGGMSEILQGGRRRFPGRDRRSFRAGRTARDPGLRSGAAAANGRRGSCEIRAGVPPGDHGRAARATIPAVRRLTRITTEGRSMEEDIQVSILNGIVNQRDAISNICLHTCEALRGFARDRRLNLRYRIFTHGTDIDSSHVQVRRSVEELLSDPFFHQSDLIDLQLWNPLRCSSTRSSSCPGTSGYWGSFIRHHPPVAGERSGTSRLPRPLPRHESAASGMRIGSCAPASSPSTSCAGPDSPRSGWPGSLFPPGWRHGRREPGPDSVEAGPAALRGAAGPRQGDRGPHRGPGDPAEKGLGSCRLTLVGNSAISSAEDIGAFRRADSAYGLDETVRWKWTSRRALEQLYAESDAFVMPSYHEGFCMPLIEALSHGLPLLHSDRGAIPETSGGLGLTFAAGQPESLAGCLERFLEESARAMVPTDRGSMAREEWLRQVSLHLENYTFQSFYDALVPHLDDLMTPVPAQVKTYLSRAWLDTMARAGRPRSGNASELPPRFTRR